MEVKSVFDVFDFNLESEILGDTPVDLTTRGDKVSLKTVTSQNINKFTPSAVFVQPITILDGAFGLGEDEEKWPEKLDKWQDDKLEFKPEYYPSPKQPLVKPEQVDFTLPEDPDFTSERIEPNPEEAFVEAETESLPEAAEGQVALLGALEQFPDDPMDFLRSLAMQINLGYLDGPMDFIKKVAGGAKKAGSAVVSGAKKVGGAVAGGVKKVAGVAGRVIKKVNPLKALKWAGQKLAAISRISLKYSKKYGRKAWQYSKKGMIKTAKAFKKLSIGAKNLAVKAGRTAWRYGRAAAKLGKKYATKAYQASKRIAKRNFDRIQKLRDEFGPLRQAQKVTTALMIGGLAIAGIAIFYFMA